MATVVAIWREGIVELNEMPQEGLLNLGTLLGHHQAFGLVANRCSAAAAESLKQIRESGEYKKLNLTWGEFCKQHAGLSRSYADRLIGHLEEFGENYFRMAEVMRISGATYRLIAGSVNDDGLARNGETIPINAANRPKLMAAVEEARQQSRLECDRSPDAATGRKQLDAFVATARILLENPGERDEFLPILEQGLRDLLELAQAVCQPD
jgi:hypothetical protein